jgi:hypothetical protein
MTSLHFYRTPDTDISNYFSGKESTNKLSDLSYLGKLHVITFTQTSFLRKKNIHACKYIT